MSEKFTHDFEKAQNGANIMQEKIKSGETKDDTETNILIDSLAQSKNMSELTSEQKKGLDELRGLAKRIYDIGWPEEVIPEILQKYKLSADTPELNEIKSIALQSMTKILKYKLLDLSEHEGDWNYKGRNMESILEFKKALGVSTSPEIQKIISENLPTFNYISSKLGSEFAKEFQVQPEDLESPVKNLIIKTPQDLTTYLKLYPRISLSQDSEIKAIAKEQLPDLIYYSDRRESADFLRNYFHFTEQEFNEEAIKAIEKGLYNQPIEIIKKTDDLLGKFSLSHDILKNSTKTTEYMTKNAMEYLRRDEVDTYKQIVEYFYLDIPKDEILKIKEKVISKHLENIQNGGDIKRIFNKIAELELEKTITFPEIEKAVEKYYSLSDVKQQEMLKEIKFYARDLFENITSTPELKEQAKKSVKSYLSAFGPSIENKLEKISEKKDVFNINNSEFQNIVQEVIKEFRIIGNYDEVKKICNFFDIQTNEFEDNNNININKENFNIWKKYNEQYLGYVSNVSDAIRNDWKFQKMKEEMNEGDLKDLFAKALFKSPNSETYIEFIRSNNFFSENELCEIAQKAYNYAVVQEQSDIAKKISENFKIETVITDAEYAKYRDKYLSFLISSGSDINIYVDEINKSPDIKDFESTIDYKFSIRSRIVSNLINSPAKITEEQKHINYPPEILSDTEVVQLAFDKTNKLLSSGKIDKIVTACQIIEIFGFDNSIVIDNFYDQINNKNWNNIVLLQSQIKICEEKYSEFLKEKVEIAQDDKIAFGTRRESFDILYRLAEAGDYSIVNEYSGIIENRSSQSDSPESKWGLDPAQEAAFYTLIRLDNPESNNALFKLLLNENVNDTVKYATLKKLSSEKRNFLTDDAKKNLRTWLKNRKTNDNQLDWRDIEFINAILKIPSTETRNNSLQLTNSMSHIYHYDEEENETYMFEYNENIYQIWKDYENIPENSFLQLHQLVEGDVDLLQKFQNLYAANKKETTKKENLLYGIVNIQYSNYENQKLVINKLREISFGAKEDIDKISELFRQIAFLDKIDELKKSSSYDDEYYEDYEDEEYERQDDGPGQSQEIIEIFSEKVESLDELINLLKETSTQKIQEILPNEKITGEKIESIEKNWGNLEPILAYLSRFPQLKEYISEMVAYFDNKEDWKNWRYDTKNKSVKSQVNFLSPEQLDVWKGDYFSEMGDIMIAESGSDKPKKVQGILEDAITMHRHIYNPKMGQNKFEHVQNVLDNSLKKIKEIPGERENIIEDDIKSVTTDAKAIDFILDFNNLSRIKQSLENILPENSEVQASKKIKDTVKFLNQYLSKDLGKLLNENYKQLEGQDKIKSDELVTPEIRDYLENKIKEIETGYKKALDSQIWGKLKLDKDNLKNLGQFYQKRQELKAIIDLLRLNNLSNKLIATNRIAEKEGKKGGETIMEVIENLKKFFKDTPLLLDLKNIESALKEKIDFGEKRRLAMILTDDPQMLWQAGKYPLGNGSCQHYAEGSYAHNLMGYVGDANCKVSYLVDLNKLPLDIKKELDEKDFEEVKEKIPTQELLNASLARSIIKLTKDKTNNPTILLEPTYTVVYKGDSSMDKYYNIFIDLMVAEPMKAKMARGGGGESVSKGHSRSPEGQYEDLNLNNVKFIHKLSKPNKEDVEIMERIRSSR